MFITMMAAMAIGAGPSLRMPRLESASNLAVARLGHAGRVRRFTTPVPSGFLVLGDQSQIGQPVPGLTRNQDPVLYGQPIFFGDLLVNSSNVYVYLQWKQGGNNFFTNVALAPNTQIALSPNSVGETDYTVQALWDTGSVTVHEFLGGVKSSFRVRRRRQGGHTTLGGVGTFYTGTYQNDGSIAVTLKVEHAGDEVIVYTDDVATSTLTSSSPTKVVPPDPPQIAPIGP